MRGLIIGAALLAAGLALAGLAAVVALPGEKQLRELIGFEYTEDAPRCVKVSARRDIGRWRAESPLPSLRDEARATVVGDSAYIVGGIGSDAEPVGRSVATFERYDFASRRYTTLPPLPMALNHVGIAAHGGDVYVIGGQGEEHDRVIATGRAFRYRIDERRWQELAPMAHARGAHGLAVVGDRIFAIGGRRDRAFSSEPNVAPVEALDLRTGRWAERDGMPEPRDHLGVAVHRGLIYVMAGRRPNGAPVRRFDRYDPTSGRWERLADAPVATSGIDLLASGDRLLSAGGEQPDTGRVLGDAWAYDVSSGRWSPMPSLPSPRHGYASVTARERWYVFGGSTCPGYQPTRAAASLPLDR